MERQSVFAAWLLLASFGVQAAVSEAPIPTDAAGRPVKDRNNGKVEYTTAPAPSITTDAKPSASSARTSGKQSRAVRMQSTGTSPSYQVQWRTSSFGTGIGATGIWPVDADHDGDLDFVLGGGRHFGGNAVWSVVSFNARTAGYEIAWQSVPKNDPYTYSGLITALRVVEAGGSHYVWVGRDDGSVEVVNLLTRETVQTLLPNSGTINDFAIADVDNDGADDVAVVTTGQTFLYDPETRALKRTIGYGGQRAAVGNVDDDSAREMVFNGGTVVQVNASDVTLEWSSSIAFGNRIELADIDGDGRDELVGAESWYVIRAWDLELHSLKWSHRAQLDINALQLIDVAGDATPEILYGDGQWGQIHVLDAATQAELWNISNPEHGVTDIAVFDADGDGAREIMWGAGFSSTGPDYLYVHDLGTRAFEWKNVDYGGPYRAVDVGDVDGDGALEIVVAAGGFDGNMGIMMVFDAATHELEWRSGGGAAFSGIRALKLMNIDADPQLEIVVGNGALYAIDGMTHEVQKTVAFDANSPLLTAIDAADLTGDGIPEVVGGNGVVSSGEPGSALFVINPVTDQLVWKSALLATGFSQVTDVLVTDVGAPGADIIGVSSLVHVVRWSDRRHIYSSTGNYLSVATGEVAPNAGIEILAGRNDGSIDVLDGETLAVIATHNLCFSQIAAMQMHSANQVVVACGNVLIVYDLATRSIVDSTVAGTSDLGTNATLARAVVNNRSVIVAGGFQAVKFVDASSNHLPLLTTTAISVHWRGSTQVQLSASDADNDALRFELLTMPSLGTAIWADASSGALRYTASASRLGSDSVQIRVTDGYQYSSTQSLQIALTNTTPSVSSGGFDLNPGAAVTGRFTASDPDSDPLTYSVTRQPTKGTLTFDASAGTFQYVGNAAGSGTDSVTFAASDGVSQSESTVEFRYLSSSGNGGGSGGGGGGGAFGTLLPGLLALLVMFRRRALPSVRSRIR